MSDLREAAQMALEALDDACGNRCNAENNPCYQRIVAEVLRAALAQPEPDKIQKAVEAGAALSARLQHQDSRWEQSEPVALDENEADPYVLWAEIVRLRAAVAGPKGFATWQDAATYERARRVRAEQAYEYLLTDASDASSNGAGWQPLYTYPPQRKPLTDEELRDIANGLNGIHPPLGQWSRDKHFARAIERAHGIGDKT